MCMPMADDIGANVGVHGFFSVILQVGAQLMPDVTEPIRAGEFCMSFVEQGLLISASSTSASRLAHVLSACPDCLN